MPSKKSKRKKGKTRGKRNSSRKWNRNHQCQDCVLHGEEVMEEIAQEKRVLPSPLQNAPVSQVHRYISLEQFPEALKILRDSDLDLEAKKKKLVDFRNEECGTTSTQQAIMKNAPYELVELLVQIGGKDAVIATDHNGSNGVHIACKYGSYELIELLVDFGGEDAITATDHNGYNGIHVACKYGSSTDIVDCLCLFGGRKALYQRNHIGELPIHNAALKRDSSTAVVRTLLAVGGREMLDCKNNYNRLPIHNAVLYFNTNLEVCQILITQGIHHGVGGEGAIGGLFSENTDITGKQGTTYDRLKKLKLHDHILEHIKHKVSQKYGSTPVMAAAKNGLKWDEGMEDLVEASRDGAIKEGLAILAASGEKTDLTTIYKLSQRYVGELFG